MAKSVGRWVVCASRWASELSAASLAESVGGGVTINSSTAASSSSCAMTFSTASVTASKITSAVRTIEPNASSAVVAAAAAVTNSFALASDAAPPASEAGGCA